jgi:UDP-N-acetyl-D-mannosaminuronic acid transferase (WecB/TagA/CpsF family)
MEDVSFWLVTDRSARAVEGLRLLYPSLQPAERDGYFDERLRSQDTEELVQRINAYEPGVLDLRQFLRLKAPG